MNIFRSIRFLEGKGCFLAAGIFLWIVLEIGYRVYVSPVYGHSGFVLAINWLKYVEGILLYLLLLAWGPPRLRRPSDFFMNVLIFSLMAPMLVFYGLADQPRGYLYIVILGYVLVDLFRRGPVLSLPMLREGPALALAIVLTGALAVSIWMFVSGGVSYFNLDLTAVYEYRREVGKAINTGLMGYVNTWAYKVFGPSLLAIALWKHQYWFAAAVCALHVYWFGVSAHKAVLFYPVLVLFIWALFSRYRALSVIPLGMLGVICLSLGVYIAFDFSYPASLFLRRAFFVAANNTFDYYEFFSNNEMVFWANSVLSSVIDYPYKLNPADLIGEWRGTGAHVNNTFLSTGYMHAGIWGIIFYGVVAGLLFRIIDSVGAYGVPPWVAVAVLIVPSRSLLLSSDIPTSLLTHGIGIGIVILLLLRSTNGPESFSRGNEWLGDYETSTARE